MYNSCTESFRWLRTVNIVVVSSGTESHDDAVDVTPLSALDVVETYLKSVSSSSVSLLAPLPTCRRHTTQLVIRMPDETQPLQQVLLGSTLH